jgi:hypothetical protein
MSSGGWAILFILLFIFLVFGGFLLLLGGAVLLLAYLGRGGWIFVLIGAACYALGWWLGHKSGGALGGLGIALKVIALIIPLLGIKFVFDD